MFYHEFTFVYLTPGGRHLILTANNRKLADQYQGNFIELGWPYVLYWKRFDMQHFAIVDMNPPQGE